MNHNLYMSIARETAKISHCKRKKVGAVIVKQDNIISFGCNGTLPGYRNCCEDTQGVTLPHVLHAEENAILKLSRDGGTGAAGATLYVTLSPCISCAKMIIRVGFNRVVVDEFYRNLDGVLLIKEHGIEVIHHALS